MIEARSVSKQFGSFVALDDVSVDVPAGSLTALLGPSGSGKSTLLRIIAGLEAPDSERVILHAKDVTNLPSRSRGVGVIFQSYALFPKMNVEQNIGYGLRLRKKARAEIKEITDGLIELTGLQEHRQKHPSQLSGGQQQQLAIARALVARPDVLLLDEPSLGLAPAIVDAVFGALAAIRERGVTALLVEQRAQRTVAFADRTYLIANGELRLTLTPEQAGDTSTMVAAYLS